jgi:hypothetical protein
MSKIGFFEEAEGVKSMSRVLAFVNLITAVWVTVSGSSVMFLLAWRCMSLPTCDLVNVVSHVSIGYDYVTLVFGLWIFVYGGKNAAKYIEVMKKDK